MKRIAILGASGHGKVVADIAAKNGYEEIVFFDDKSDLKQCEGYPVVGDVSAVENWEQDVFVAIGDSCVRERISETLTKLTLSMPTLIHPNAVIAASVVIDPGCVAMAGAVINPYCHIGRGTIINTSSSVDHDCTVGSYCHIAVGSHVCGTVSIGDRVWVGAGAVISNNLSICDDVTIGAGAVVIHDINEPGTYVGNPARRIA